MRETQDSFCVFLCVCLRKRTTVPTHRRTPTSPHTSQHRSLPARKAFTYIGLPVPLKIHIFCLDYPTFLAAITWSVANGLVTRIGHASIHHTPTPCYRSCFFRVRASAMYVRAFVASSAYIKREHCVCVCSVRGVRAQIMRSGSRLYLENAALRYFGANVSAHTHTEMCLCVCVRTCARSEERNRDDDGGFLAYRRMLFVLRTARQPRHPPTHIYTPTHETDDAHTSHTELRCARTSNVNIIRSVYTVGECARWQVATHASRDIMLCTVVERLRMHFCRSHDVCVCVCLGVCVAKSARRRR